MDAAASLLERFRPKQSSVLTAEPEVCQARFTPCGRFLLAGGYDARLHRWDMTAEGHPELPPVGGHNGWLQALTCSGEIVFTGDSWGQLRATPFVGERPEPRWTVADAHDGWIRDIAVSPDGQRLATCGADRQIRLWSTADGARQRELSGHDWDVFCLRFHPDGQSLFSADQKGRIRRWNPATGEVLREYDATVLFTYRRIQDTGGVRCLTLDRTGQRLLCGGTQPKTSGNVTGIPTVLVFSVEDGRLQQTIELGTTNDVYVCDLHLHDDGFLMAVTSGQPGAGKIVFQRLEDKEPFFAETKIANCHSLSLHPAGRRLAVSAVSRNSNGNGRRLDKDGKYPGNSSPIHLFDLGTA